jgi:thiol:disulfide interchange protein
MNSYQLFVVFILSFAGGLLMNLMPCILPLISLKISGFLKHSHSKTDFIKSNLAYSGGILTFFTSLGLFIFFSKGVAQSVMLTGHMQSGIFLLCIFFVLLLVAMNFSGLFEINIHPGSSSISKILSKFKGRFNCFLNGFFVSILSISCTAPFIVTAMTYAMQSNINLALTMLGISLGFSLPFILSAIFAEKVLNFLPKPGKWFDQFKTLLSFPIYAAALWILFILIKQKNDLYIAIALSYSLCLYLIIWIGKNFQLSFFKKIIFYGLPIILCYLVLPIPLSVNNLKENFSLNTFQNAIEKKEKIMVVGSASWCVTCYVNEKNALQSNDFATLLKKKKIKYLYLDLTNKNPDGEKFLTQYNHSGVPFYIIFNSKGEYEILPQTLTKNLVEEKISNLN